MWSLIIGIAILVLAAIILKNSLKGKKSPCSSCACCASCAACKKDNK